MHSEPYAVNPDDPRAPPQELWDRFSPKERASTWPSRCASRGEARKELERNVERYARLGIREYFFFDWGRRKLNGWRLTEPARRTYSPILPQHGFYRSEVLGLELQLEGERLRFYMAGAALQEDRERIATLEQMVEEHRNEEARLRVALEQQLAEEARLYAEEARLYAEEARLRAEEQQRREQAERQLAEALAELERLRGKK